MHLSVCSFFLVSPPSLSPPPSSLQCTSLEAKLCQVESKYLVLLQEVKTPVCSSSEQSAARDVISRLLEDAL